MLKKHKDNLLKLADYLDKLPKEYVEKHFNMKVFYAVGIPSPYYDRGFQLEGKDIDEPRKPLNTCGTCACAVGHGPSAGIRIYKDRSWFAYCERVFGIDSDGCTFNHLFGPDNPNDSQLVAKRIRNYVETGATQDAD